METKCAKLGDHWVAEHDKEKISFPDPIPLVKFIHILCGYSEWVFRKYNLPGFVEVEGGEIVVDCGAYVGGFSRGAARIAAHLHVFEPETSNFQCLLRNVPNSMAVKFDEIGLFNATGTEILNIAISSVEHSILPPDDGDPVRSEEVLFTRLDDYLNKLKLPQIDFLKLEAEGVEPDILEGLGDILPRKIVVDVSVERLGASPLDQIVPWLEARGYETQRRLHVLFAKLKPTSA